MQTSSLALKHCSDDLHEANVESKLCGQKDVTSHLYRVMCPVGCSANVTVTSSKTNICINRFMHCSDQRSGTLPHTDRRPWPVSLTSHRQTPCATGELGRGTARADVSRGGLRSHSPCVAVPCRPVAAGTKLSPATELAVRGTRGKGPPWSRTFASERASCRDTTKGLVLKVVLRPSIAEKVLLY
jgi:hypothetical protein